VTVLPVAAVAPGPGVPGGTAGVPFQIALDQGQHAQISQAAELTGSVVTSNKPVGFMAGHLCMSMPADVYFCDHAEQMIPPVRALGSHYVGVMYRPRVPAETSTFWRLVGVVDDTRLAYSADVGGPATLRRGHSIESDAPFGVWVWGWGTPLTAPRTSNASYGYPAGMNVSLINEVEVR